MNGPEPPKWYPSRRQMVFEWYARFLMRYIVGPGVIAWELAADHGKNLAVLLVGAMLASSTDVVNIVRGLIAQARFEKKELDELVRQELDDHDEDKTN